MADKIYTGYFARLKYYKEHDLTPVSIALKTPDFASNLINLTLFAPSPALLSAYRNGTVTETEYTQIYTQHLETHKNDIYTTFMQICNISNNPIILLCYETPEKFCHRHILADYANRNFNMNITEYSIIKNK